MAELEEKVALGWLLDFYGPLLTEHRSEVLRLYCEEDMSLAEIAAQLSITRQGVSDAVNKARKKLEEYEQKLGLVARYRAIGQEVETCLSALDEIAETQENADALRRARAALDNIEIYDSNYE